jgi:tRNA dimethylallyltransferase
LGLISRLKSQRRPALTRKLTSYKDISSLRRQTGLSGDNVKRIDAVVIAGPTASGKSALALRLARSVGGTIVNVDSMQVYGDLRILTARPTPDEEAAAPHRLFGTIDGAVNFSAGRYAAAVATILAEARTAGSLPILVGGTGLYLRTVTTGLSAMPAVPDAVRVAVRARAEGRPSADLHADLAARDPETAARLGRSDRQRILRALEVKEATGRPLSSFHVPAEPGPLAGARLACVFLNVDRVLLRERIDRRFNRMMEGGALDEVDRLVARGLDPALPVMRAHGVPGLIAYRRGEEGLAEAVARGQADTRAYAKRQVTWFRHQMADFRLLAPEAAYEALASLVALSVRS